MSPTEQAQSEQAFQWIKHNESLLISTFCAGTVEESVDALTSIFMAGSPGAGKTEVSKRLVDTFKRKPVRIDADEIRALCPGYAGNNAHIFQKAATKGVNILYNHVLHSSLNTILDGTFAYAGALENIKRSIDKNRKVMIVYVYQDPLVAWGFTKKREKLEKRHVSKEVFINAFYQSQIHVNEAKAHFGNRIQLAVFIKEYDKRIETSYLDAEKIDPYLPKIYTKEELNKLIL